MGRGGSEPHHALRPSPGTMRSMVSGRGEKTGRLAASTTLQTTNGRSAISFNLTSNARDHVRESRPRATPPRTFSSGEPFRRVRLGCERKLPHVSIGLPELPRATWFGVWQQFSAGPRILGHSRSSEESRLPQWHGDPSLPEDDVRFSNICQNLPHAVVCRGERSVPTWLEAPLQPLCAAWPKQNPLFPGDIQRSERR